MLIFLADEMKYFWHLPKKKVNFLLIFPLRGKKKLFPRYFSIILLGSAHLVGIILSVNAVCI